VREEMKGEKVRDGGEERDEVSKTRSR